MSAKPFALRALRRLPSSRRHFSQSLPTLTRWTPGPAPPRLPKEDQEIFERLQQQSTGAFSTPRQDPSPEQPASTTATQDASSSSTPESRSEVDRMLELVREKARVNAQGDGEELHPNVRRGAPPEFEGDTNPQTGEVGGPKNNPLRWGDAGDWSYNGRVTDF